MVTKILIADDEPAIRHMLRRAFESLSWKVWEAEDGEQALSMALLERFDLVISDYCHAEVERQIPAGPLPRPLPQTPLHH